MLGYDYLVFNSEKLPWAKKNSVKITNTENIGKSEAGTLIGTVTRLMQKKYTYQFTVTDFYYEKLAAIANLAQGRLYINGDAGHDVMPRMVSYDLVQNSELTAGTDGLWTVTMEFTEI